MTAPTSHRGDTLLTVAAVADRLRVQVRTVRAWHHRGIGPRFVMNAQRLVTTERELDAWLARCHRSTS